MLLDRFTASYYQSRGKLKSLINLKKFELQRDVGVLFSKDTEGLARCLINFRRSDILRSAQTLTDTYKVTFLRFKTRFANEHFFLPWLTLISPAHRLSLNGLHVMKRNRKEQRVAIYGSQGKP